MTAMEWMVLLTMMVTAHHRRELSADADADADAAQRTSYSVRCRERACAVACLLALFCFVSLCMPRSRLDERIRRSCGGE